MRFSIPPQIGAVDSLIHELFFKDLRRFLVPETLVRPDVPTGFKGVSLIHPRNSDSPFGPSRRSISYKRERFLVAGEFSTPRFITPYDIENRGL